MLNLTDIASKMYFLKVKHFSYINDLHQATKLNVKLFPDEAVIFFSDKN